MAKVLLSGYYGFQNLGDEAILSATLDAFRSLRPDLEPVVLSGNPRQTAAVHGVRAVHRLCFPALVPQVDLVVSGGGGLLQDVTSFKSLAFYLSVLAWGKACGKPLAVYGNSVGPITTPWGRALARWVLSRVHVITLRDEQSMVELSRLGVTNGPSMAVTTDPAFLLQPAEDAAGEALLDQAGVPRDGAPILAVSVRAYRNNTHLPVVARALTRLQRELGAHVLLFPIQPRVDVPVLQRIAAHMQVPAYFLNKSATPQQVMAALGRARLVIGMRLHALIFAVAQAVPAVGIVYDPKVEGLLKSVGLASAGQADALDEERLVAVAAAAWAEAPAEVQRLRAQRQELRRLALENACRTLALLP